jgi:dephospho-CoA kinase
LNTAAKKKPESTVIAITGGIGSGKSVVTKLFEQWGAKIVDADILAREVVKAGSEGLRKVLENFDDMMLADGSLNRPKLASIIFSDPEKEASRIDSPSTYSQKLA